MIRATSPPAAQPTVGLSFSGQMTHTAYTSPPQTIIPANAPKALNSSRILVTSFSLLAAMWAAVARCWLMPDRVILPQAGHNVKGDFDPADLKVLKG